MKTGAENVTFVIISFAQIISVNFPSVREYIYTDEYQYIKIIKITAFYLMKVYTVVITKYHEGGMVMSDQIFYK